MLPRGEILLRVVYGKWFIKAIAHNETLVLVFQNNKQFGGNNKFTVCYLIFFFFWFELLSNFTKLVQFFLVNGSFVGVVGSKYLGNMEGLIYNKTKQTSCLNTLFHFLTEAEAMRRK
jgi:hypothetical protein